MLDNGGNIVACFENFVMTEALFCGMMNVIACLRLRAVTFIIMAGLGLNRNAGIRYPQIWRKYNLRQLRTAWQFCLHGEYD